MIRTAKHPRVQIDHPRYPEPSTAKLWAPIDGKRGDIVEISMTENELYSLSEEALKVAAVLRRQREEGRVRLVARR